MTYDEDYMTPDSYEPDGYDDNADQQRDEFAAAVDAGEACYHCHATKCMDRVSACGIPLFTCRFCHESSFDLITQPTKDAWSVVLA